MKKLLAMIILATLASNVFAASKFGEYQGIPDGKCIKTFASAERDSYGESSASTMSEAVKPSQVTIK